MALLGSLVERIWKEPNLLAVSNGGASSSASRPVSNVISWRKELKTCWTEEETRVKEAAGKRRDAVKVQN